MRPADDFYVHRLARTDMTYGSAISLDDNPDKRDATGRNNGINGDEGRNLHRKIPSCSFPRGLSPVALVRDNDSNRVCPRNVLFVMFEAPVCA